MTTDPIYLDGSQPYHRHPNEGPRIFKDREECSHDADLEEATLPTRVLVFDEDALAAHDDAIRQEADQGLTEPPLWREDQWEFAILEPVEPGQEATDARVMAGWTPSGEFLRYCSVERLAAAMRTAIEEHR